MPRGYRLFVVAALGCLALGNASPRNAHNYRKQQTKPDQPQAAAPPVKPAADANPHEGDDKPCKGTSRSDLSCDAISAQASYDQARDADAGFLIGVVQAIVGLATLGAAVFAAKWAKAAAEHTKDGAEEAGRAADTAEDTFATEKTNARPWLSVDVEPSAVVIRERPGVKEFLLEFTIVLENLGATIAQSVVLEYGVFCKRRPPFEQVQIVDPMRADFSSGNTISPGEKVRMRYVMGLDFDTIEWVAAVNGITTTTPLVAILVRYRFDEKTGSTFRKVWIGQAGPDAHYGVPIDSLPLRNAEIASIGEMPEST
jgi:hypothetical protein